MLRLAPAPNIQSFHLRQHPRNTPDRQRNVSLPYPPLANPMPRRFPRQSNSCISNLSWLLPSKHPKHHKACPFKSCPHPLTNPMLRRPPRHTQQPKNFPLILTLHQSPLRNPLSVPPPQNILPQPPLIQPHALPTRQQPYTPIEDIVPREIYQRGSDLCMRDEQEINAVPDLRSRECGAPCHFEPSEREVEARACWR